MRRFVAPRVAVLVVAVVAIFVAGAGAAVLWMHPVAPGALEPAIAATTAPVSSQEFTDPRPVRLTIVAAPGAPIESGVGGRVTATACEPGSSVASGSTLVAIDGRPVVALATQIPLWRDIRSGDQGADVEALQAELTRLGLPTPVDGRAGRGTLARAAELFVRAGDDTPLGEAVPSTRLAWIPAGTVTVESCAAAMGSTVTAGAVLATTSGGIASASVSSMPADLIEGDRTVTVDSVALPVAADGTISGPDALRALAATPSYLRSIRGAEQDVPDPAGESGSRDPEVSGELALRSPLSIGVVPPSAVYAVSGRNGCVASADAIHRVEVVGSQLGRTFVRFAGDPPAAVRIDAEARPSCT